MVMDNNNVKKCKRCNTVRDLSEFYRRKYRPNAFSTHCKSCVQETNRLWKQNNRQQKIKKDIEYSQNNKQAIAERSRKYRENNKEKIKHKHKLWANNNPEKIRNNNNKWKSNNPHKKNNCEGLRRAKKLQATPPWAELDKIKIVYEKAKWLEKITGLKYHVDHKIGRAHV